jgi:hypothetical protein
VAKIDAELIEFLHKVLDMTGSGSLHGDLDKLNEDVAKDIKSDDDAVKPTFNVATSKP